ncbi:YPL105C [Saccharomyces arboricola H-6]|uniref:YPL105C n=1 Tax=Saccharomyces arboricola (strain H-6 / AS 2.3317 / CBS 10644) TaxID=1160507 RepID=J8Q1B5_SACAR|nr:YPL105C [Saccharomyces arboricola H-6]
MNPINPLALDLHNIKLADSNSDITTLSSSNTPMVNNTAPLQRTSSLMDSIGIQRASSPFTPVSSNVVNEACTVSTNAYGTEGTGSNPHIPIDQGNSRAFNVASNLHMSTSSPSLTNIQSETLPGTGSYLYNPAGLAPNAGNQLPPPGIESQWKYIDSNGNIQGPFGTNNMSQWYQAGYFTPTLQICRLATSIEPFRVSDRFITLGELTTLVNNYQDPFATFDFIVIAALSGIPLATPITPEDQKAETRASESVADVHSDDFTYEEILGLKFEDGSYYHETHVWVPVNGRHVTKVDHIPENFGKPKPADPSPIKPVQRASPEERKTSLDEQKAPPNKTSGEEQMLYTATNENEEVRNAEVQNASSDSIEVDQGEVDVKDGLSDDKETENNNASEIPSEEQKRFAKAELMAQKLLEEQQRQEEEKKRREEQRKLKKEKKLKQKQKKEEDKLKKKKKEDGKLEKERQKELLNSILNEDTDASPQAESPVASSSTNLAPWANKKTNDAVYNQITSALEVLKNKNSSKKEKKPSRTQLDREEALRLQKEILGSAQPQATSNTGSVWGIKPQQPIKLDIKEELMKNSKNTNGLPTTNKAKMTNNGNTKSGSTFIEEQKKLWEQVQKISGTSSSSSSVSTSSNADNGWTTVSSQSTTKTATSAVPASVNQPRSYISPEKLRSSGGTSTTGKAKASGKGKQIGSSTSIPTLKARQVKPSRAPAYPGNASVSKRQEFLKWCRSQLKLNSGVQPDNVLEMLLSLPPRSESKEIIADTIYSYSSTMDGRRFATDFIKKRLECEEQISDPLSWSEVLTMPEGSSEDWEFQVVGKKKGRRF